MYPEEIITDVIVLVLKLLSIVLVVLFTARYTQRTRRVIIWPVFVIAIVFILVDFFKPHLYDAIYYAFFSPS